MSLHKILVVEDEPDIREVLTSFLMRRGHEVCQATTGAQGLLLMNREQPHLLLTDKILPDCLGYDLIRSAKDQRGNRQLRTVLMTGDDTDDMKERDAPDMVLLKPFALRELASVVERLLAR